jgi:ribosomal protein S12 methylthiotransferase
MSTESTKLARGRLQLVGEHGSTGGCGTSGGSCGTSEPETLRLEAAAVVADRDFAGNVALVTLGCAKNLVDSEVMLGALRQRGFREISDPSAADVIVVNTCAFLSSAAQESIDTILDLSRWKKEGRCRKLVVAGCLVERYRGELKENLPEVDQFISTDELLKVGELDETTAECLDSSRRPYFIYDETMPRVISTGGHTAFIKISEGCNRPCAFCIIPKLRGAFRSRSQQSIVNEAAALIRGGVRELSLVGQDLTAYGTDFPANRGIISELPSLLDSIVACTSSPFWLRLLYAYPVGVTEELINTLRSSPNLCRYLDMPLQHISASVLKSMRRPLGAKGTRALIERIRSTAPEVALRTTFIVGFPGETEQDVQELVEFVREGHFTHVGVFEYSQEEGTPAYKMGQQVSTAEKKRRRKAVMEAQQAVVESRFNSLIGQTIKVLIDGEHEESDLLLSGRTEWQAIETDGSVIINEVDESVLEKCGYDLTDEMTIRAADFTGRFAEVEITDFAGYDLVGKIKRLTV